MLTVLMVSGVGDANQRVDSFGDNALRRTATLCHRTLRLKCIYYEMSVHGAFVMTSCSVCLVYVLAIDIMIRFSCLLLFIYILQLPKHCYTPIVI